MTIEEGGKYSQKAVNNYHKEHLKGVSLKLHRELDKDIIDHLEAQPNKQGYLKQLIRADIQKNK